MQADTITGKAKFVVNAKGQPTEVILPYRVYQDLLRLKMSHEIYEQADTQEAIHSAKREKAKGKTKRFTSIDRALKWLDE